MKNSFLLILLSLSLFSCTNSEAESRDEAEKSSIESYIANQESTYIEIDGVYRILLKESEFLTPNNLSKGDSLYINYAIYDFTGSVGNLIDTNIEELAVENGLSLTMLDFSEKKIKYGTTNLVEGLNIGLDGCEDGGQYGFLIPSKYGYGDLWNGYVEPNSILYIECEITSVKKN